MYTCPLGGDDFEITARISEPEESGEGFDGRARASWGRDASVRRFVDGFAEMCPPVRQLLGLVGRVQQFDYFAGPRLETAVSHGAVALIGDASHPLSGAFGAGAGFALEDAFVLGGAVEWAFAGGRALADGLVLFDEVRSPHYQALYDVLDGFAQAEVELARLALPPNEEIESRIRRVWDARNNWMYYHEVSPPHRNIATMEGFNAENITYPGRQGSCRSNQGEGDTRRETLTGSLIAIEREHSGFGSARVILHSKKADHT